jgi:LysM repeat protein
VSHFYESIIFTIYKTVDMSETRILPVIALIIALIVSSVASAQVPVEVSNEKIVSGGKTYYMHEVLKGQTLYSISRAYKVTIDAITSENIIPASGIQAGQVMRIRSNEPMPVKQTPSRTDNKAATGSMSSAATTGPGREVVRDGITISKEKTVSSGKVYFLHEVQKGQTLYSLAKAYQVTILDIDRENAIPAGGIRAGQVLRIPASSSLVSVTEGKNSTSDIEEERPVEAAAKAVPQPSRTQTQMPSQESTRQTSQLPRQEQATAGTGISNTPAKQADSGTPAQTREASTSGPEPEEKTQSADTREPVTKQARPERKKIHKVQKGESLADIAKKYNLTVQELKKANKGVIFAMPDMRLVIPSSDGSDSQD